jgi:hypothetical protein
MWACSLAPGDLLVRKLSGVSRCLVRAEELPVMQGMRQLLGAMIIKEDCWNRK